MAQPRPLSLAPKPPTAALRAWLEQLPEPLESACAWWLSGYFAALAEAGARAGVAMADAPAPGASAIPLRATAAAPFDAHALSVVYGTQTGNARAVAERLAAAASARGLRARLLRADAYPLAALREERRLLIVISTQGDGDPPDDARAFVEHLLGRRAPRLEHLGFAVLGLGDSTYPKFCAVARALDARLTELGATRLVPLGEADTDIDTVAAPWIDAVLLQLAAARAPALALVTSSEPERAPAPTAAAEALSATREQPLAAELLENVRLTARDSTRDIRHLVFAIDPARLDYLPGDAAGVWPVHPEALVDEVLAATGLDGQAPVTHAGQTRALREWLRAHRELSRVHRALLHAHAARLHDAGLRAQLADPEFGARLIGACSVPDLLHAYPAAWSAAELVAALRPLAPRLYSIASYRAAVGEELHLTVAHRVHTSAARTRHGTASHHLAELRPGENARLYIAPNPRFRLPAAGDCDLIMIGPGTGVAPFRAFVQARAASGARGRNWLFFGNPHFRRDFLYQTEWQQALKAGHLHRLSLAFSRDQPTRVYVQHRLQEHGAEVWDWLERGAHIYVCGDAARMARDVDAALRALAGAHGGLDAEAAADYFHRLEREGRYARDVY